MAEPKFGERQPIETAPKDQPIILLVSGGWFQGFWEDGLGWLTGVDDGLIHIRIKLEPTHWMPLPEPPEPSRG